jgi:hypothetical protein
VKKKRDKTKNSKVLRVSFVGDSTLSLGRERDFSLGKVRGDELLGTD